MGVRCTNVHESSQAKRLRKVWGIRGFFGEGKGNFVADGETFGVLRNDTRPPSRYPIRRAGRADVTRNTNFTSPPTFRGPSTTWRQLRQAHTPANDSIG